MYRGGSSNLGFGRGKGGRGCGGGGGGGRGRNRNLLPPPTNRHSPASLRQRNTTSVEETLRIVPREVPLAFGMTIRLAPDLMEEIKRVEAQGGTAKIKFDALPNSSTGNIIDVDGKEFKFTWCSEPGNLCDIYEEHQSGEDGSGVLVEAGCAWRKLNVQRTLDEPTTSHFKTLSVEAEQRTKSRKLIVLDPATASPSLKKQLARAEAPRRMSNKQKKEPPPKKRKVDPAPVVIGGPKPSFRPGASKNRLSASLGPSPSNQYDTSCGTANIAKTHADNLNVTPVKIANYQTPSNLLKPVKTRGGESMVASEKHLSMNTSGRQETNVNEDFDLHVLLVDLLKEAPMSFEALAKAVGDRTPDEAKLIVSILEKIANFQAPSNFLKPGAGLEMYTNHSTDSKSSPEHQQLLQITDSSCDQLPVPGVSNMENFSVCERKGEGSQDSLHVHLEEKLSAQENVDVEKYLPGILHEEKRFENRDGRARISNNNDSGSDRGSSSDREASSVSKEVSDEDVDVIMSDGDKEQSAERDAIDLSSAEIEGFKKKLPEVSVSHKSTPTARDLQGAELQLLEQRLQFVRNSTKLFKNRAAYEASQREFQAEEFGRLKLDIGRINDRVNHLYEYFSAICEDSQPSERKFHLEHLNASAGQMIDPLKELQKSSNDSGSGSSSDSEASSVRKEVSDEDVDMMSDGDKEQSAERDAIDLPSAEIEAELLLLEERLQVERNSIKLFKNMAKYEASQRELLAEDYRRLKLDIGRLKDRVNHWYEYFSGSVSASHKKRKKVSVVEPLVQFPATCKDSQPSERKYDLEHLNASAGQMNPGDSSGKSNKHSDALGNVRGGKDQPDISEKLDKDQNRSSVESKRQKEAVSMNGPKDATTRIETAQVSPEETAEPIQVLTESSLILESKSDGVSGESRTENVELISLEKSLMLGDVMEGTDLQDASVRGKYKDVFDGFELLINGSGDLAPESCVNFCEALDVNDLGYDGLPKKAIDLVQSTVEIPGVADEFQVDSREGDEKVSEITMSKAVSCGVFETNDEEMHDVEISGDDGDNMIIIEDDFPIEMHKETHVSHEVLDKRGEGATSKSSSFEVLSVENGVKENDLTSKNQEKMASQTCIKNKSVPSNSEEAKARKKEAKARKKRAQESIALGVKKSKLKPPVAPKPKPITSCRHYHSGRCLKGEQCKFSHDTTPETISLPCRFLATQSCMKGDDCPYDHDLSKYPCNNFVTKGFCHRGDKCLFSHKDTPQAASDRPGANVTTSSSNIAAASFPPKPIISCRHHLRGRCLEGEQCKFSHDTTPETKSLPCCYLATQSCMKGDDCLYDHDLSKYPCNNFVTNGFCRRGDKCLFSHKGTPQAASDRPGANVLPQKSNKQSVRQAIARLQATQPRVSSSTTFLKPPSQSNQKNSSDASSSKINEHATPPQLPPLRKPSLAPKGMSFLSFDKTTQEEDTSKKL